MSKRDSWTEEQRTNEAEGQTRRRRARTAEEKAEFLRKQNIRQRARYARPEVRAKLVKRSKDFYATPEGKRANKNQRLQAQFGITLEDFEELLRLQGGRCAICATKESGGSGTFHVDHDHETGNVRGLLCNTCNLMLGHAKDDSWILTRAIEYLGRAYEETRLGELADRMMAEYLAEKATAKK